MKLRFGEGGLLAAALDFDELAVFGKDDIAIDIGGGVFGNPRGLVFSSIVAAFDALRADGYALDVVVNGRDLTGDVPAAELRARTAERGGCLVEVR